MSKLTIKQGQEQTDLQAGTYSKVISQVVKQGHRKNKPPQTARPLSEEALIKGFREGQSEALKTMYRKHYPSVERFVCKHNGNSEDAKDIFQDALLVTFQKVTSPDFTLTCRLGSFVFAVASRMWLKMLRDERPIALQTTHQIDDIEDEGMDALIRRIQRYKLYEEKFALLSKSSQKLLKLFFQGKSTAEVKEIMGFGSISYTKKRKCLCKAKLIKLIVSDPAYKQLTSYE